LAFGFQYRMYDLPRGNASTSGFFDAGTLATSLYDSTSTPSNPLAAPLNGAGIANFYLGVLNYSAGFRRPTAFLRHNEYETYIQDTWKLTPRLTLNLGLPHELRTPLKDRSG
jgi:hypothetical protein